MAMDILEKENDEEIGETKENNNTVEGGYDEEGRQIGQPLELEDASLDTEPLNDKELMTVPENEDLNISSGQQVRNKAICSVQVKCWDDYKSETLDHLWACITKWSFDDPENRQECVMKHAQRLFRGARSKLKSKYFNDKNLKTKDELLKNKPSHLTKVEWKFLVDYWSEEAVMEKSKKASESRAHQKMPHYNGTKSFGRTRQEIKLSWKRRCQYWSETSQRDSVSHFQHPKSLDFFVDSDSNRSKIPIQGLVEALSEVVPNAETRFCVRHIWANFKLKFTGSVFKELFWSAARATTFRKKNGGKCSRVDVLVATRTRKSEKAVNAINLANKTHAVDE
ncbi:uncharacterized protein LOC110729230 isoform X2 [Chenopodium quinoa]|uniref:uncharacterized protein LOC110729230 isoform X2 n=1 Tax=Chenopodium quinoa TaxID=63459 RepID=UPI000B76FF4E|nr:uncharacterized protein LOC110729230 isoform X2 [Chenopodium quinoa]